MIDINNLVWIYIFKKYKYALELVIKTALMSMNSYILYYITIYSIVYIAKYHKKNKKMWIIKNKLGNIIVSINKN